MKLSVCTYNIHRCVGTDGSYRPDRVGDILKTIDADVFALQEVDIGTVSESGDCHATAFAELCSGHALTGATLHEGAGYGNAVLTQFKPTNVDRVDLSVTPYEPRGAIIFSLKIRGTEVRFASLHLGLNYAERSEQIKKLMPHIPKEGPCVLLGDFNEWIPFSPHFKTLGATFTPGRIARTFPTRLPVLALDRIFVRDGNVLKRKVIKNRATRVASDHYPVYAEIEF